MNAGFNIDDESVKTVVVDTIDIALGLQAKGRVRHPLDKFVFIYNNKEKTPYFRDLNNAKEFFRAEHTDDFLKGYCFQGDKRKDILAYRCDDAYRVNPFAKSIYEYIFDIYTGIAKMDKENCTDYFNVLNEHSSNQLRFLSADKLAVSIRNSLKFKSLNISELFGFKDGELSKIITASELKEIANTVNIKDEKGNVYGKETLCNYINSLGNFNIRNIGVKKKYKRKTCYEIKKVQKTLG